MPRAIVAGARVEPWGELDAHPVPGPDEDAFTLAVAAIDRLDPPGGIGRVAAIHPFGPFPASLGEEFGEAIGRAGIRVEPPRPAADLGSALTERLDAGEVAPEILLALTAPDEPPSSGTPLVREAVALLLDGGAGIGRNRRLPYVGGTAGLALDGFVEFLRSSPVAGPNGTDRPAWSERSVSSRHRFHWPSLDQYRQASSTDPRIVSEGAYLPTATYRAHRPGRWRLATADCRACGTRTFPWTASCPECRRSDQLERRELPRTGLVVEATTVVHPGAQPSEFDQQVGAAGSYEVVVARVEEGIRVTLQVAGADPGAVRIGDRVDAVLRRLFPMEGSWRYGLKAVPELEGTSASAPKHALHSA